MEVWAFPFLAKVLSVSITPHFKQEFPVPMTLCYEWWKYVLVKTHTQRHKHTDTHTCTHTPLKLILSSIFIRHLGPQHRSQHLGQKKQTRHSALLIFVHLTLSTGSGREQGFSDDLMNDWTRSVFSQKKLHEIIGPRCKNFHLMILYLF